ncbi:MAG: hypothetical protein ACRDRV_07850 [Pseudonocardiaceae bacterium]
MSAGQSGPMILIIGVRDDFSHVYGNEQELLADGGFCAEAGGRFGALEFFDSEGYRLAGTYDENWRLLGLTRTAECDDERVLQRVQDSLKQLRCYIESHSQEFTSLSMTMEDALLSLPDLDGMSDLAMCMTTLKNCFGHSGQRSADGEIGQLETQGFVDGVCHVTGWCR